MHVHARAKLGPAGRFALTEGIESELQLSELRRLGIRFGQGFHLGEPVPLRDSPDA